MSQSFSHTVYFCFGGIDFARLYSTEHFSEATMTEDVYDSFSIDDARALRMRLQEFTTERSVMLIRIEKMSFETQNVLLKVCEELSHLTLVFSFPARLILLDTLASRGVVIREETADLFFEEKVIKEFVGGTFSTRTKIFDKLSKESGDLEPRILVMRLIEDLLAYSQKQNIELPNKHTFLEALDLLEYQKSSPKQVFEYLALLLGK